MRYFTTAVLLAAAAQLKADKVSGSRSDATSISAKVIKMATTVAPEEVLLLLLLLIDSITSKFFQLTENLGNWYLSKTRTIWMSRGLKRDE